MHVRLLRKLSRGKRCRLNFFAWGIWTNPCQLKWTRLCHYLMSLNQKKRCCQSRFAQSTHVVVPGWYQMFFQGYSHRTSHERCVRSYLKICCHNSYIWVQCSKRFRCKFLIFEQRQAKNKERKSRLIELSLCFCATATEVRIQSTSPKKREATVRTLAVALRCITYNEKNSTNPDCSLFM